MFRNCILQYAYYVGDYHDEMTANRFEHWWSEQLLPSIPPKSLIVMDNASYHSRRSEPHPVKSWTKKKMVEWLQVKKIAFPEKCLKKKIWEIVKSHRPINPEYVVDHLAKSAGHEVVRLPVAHCELNPIEMAWAQMKNYIKKNNIKFTLSEIERLTHTAFTVVTPNRWKSLITHVQQKVENHYWEVDGLQQELVEEFIISTEGDSESELESETDTSSDDSDDSE